MDRILKSKCRYCAGDLILHTYEDRNVIGEKGYNVELVCDVCKSKAVWFVNSVDMVRPAENKLLELYGVKENDK